MNELRILIAENDHDHARLLKHQLLRGKFEVIGTASTQREIRQLYMHKQPDLALVKLELYNSEMSLDVLRSVQEYLDSNDFLYLVFGKIPIPYLLNQPKSSPLLHKSNNKTKPFKTLSLREQEWLKDFETYIVQHMDMISVPMLATAFNMSESTLLRKIKQFTGLTTTKYLQEMRMQQAQRLLKERRFRSVAKVAAKVGYSDARAFARTYQKRFGELPSKTIRIQWNSE